MADRMMRRPQPPVLPRWTANRVWPVFLLMVLILPSSSFGNPPDGYQYDPDTGREIMELCAGCHGEFGQGGGGGEYPRLAGMSSLYLAKELRKFKSGERENMAMAPYTNERELPESDLLDVSTYLAGLELYSVMPPFDPDLDSYQKLLLAKRVFNVPRYPGDPAAGELTYNSDCRTCHGEGAVGRGSYPRLAGQYSEYLRRQIATMVEGKGRNRRMQKVLKNLNDQEINDLLAYLSLLDD